MLTILPAPSMHRVLNNHVLNLARRELQPLRCMQTISDGRLCPTPQQRLTGVARELVRASSEQAHGAWNCVSACNGHPVLCRPRQRMPAICSIWRMVPCNG